MTGSQVEVLPGGHLVASLGPAVIVVAHRESAPLRSTSASFRALDAIGELVTQATEADPANPGRPLARLATMWIVSRDDDLEFGVLSPADDGLAVFLHGGVIALFEDAEGNSVLTRGRDAAFTVDRVVRMPSVAASLFVEGLDGSQPELPAEPGVGSLVQGTAVGGGAVLWFGAQPAPELPEPVVEQPVSTRKTQGRQGPDTNLIPQVEAQPVPREHVVLNTPTLSARIDDHHEHEPMRAPLPIVAVKDATAPGVKVRGFRCSRKHLNDPRVAFCSVCGIRMDQQTGILTQGVRPPLGLLVLDDGTTYVLDVDCVLGRDPEKSDPAREGMRPVRLDDSSGGMSRAHAEIRLVEWDVTVVDRGSTNGTHVRMPGQREWTRLTPGQSTTLMPGTEITLGNRTLTFDSPHGRL